MGVGSYDPPAPQCEHGSFGMTEGKLAIDSLGDSWGDSSWATFFSALGALQSISRSQWMGSKGHPT